MAEVDEPRRESRPVTRVLIAIVAALAIGFCAWSMSQYVADRDPLALIDGSGALQTTAETDPSTQMASISVSRSIGEQDVRGALSSLSFDGRDVSLASDQASVVVSGDGVWVVGTGFRFRGRCDRPLDRPGLGARELGGERGRSNRAGHMDIGGYLASGPACSLHRRRRCSDSG